MRNRINLFLIVLVLLAGFSGATDPGGDEQLRVLRI